MGDDNRVYVSSESERAVLPRRSSRVRKDYVEFTYPKKSYKRRKKDGTWEKEEKVTGNV